MLLKLLALFALAYLISANNDVAYSKFVSENQFQIPFKIRLKDSLSEGQTIHAVGTLGLNPKRVDFNFHKGAHKDADLPLHFSIRFDEGIFSGKLVYNTFRNKTWDNNEQRVSNPFKANEEFDLRIRIINGKYQVFANRYDVGFFEQRQPLDGVDHVSINGDMSSLRLFHYGGRVIPIPYSAIAELRPGRRLDVSGVARGNRFNINLMRENHEFALQVSFRFSEGAVVRNAMTDNAWGEEERDGKLPFKKDEVFDVMIANEEQVFQIYINGKKFATFTHRGTPSDIKTIEIDGDVEIHSVTINEVKSH